jgi:hypothetical protein
VSSTFLYVGIVAIWAFFLVPRWLRRTHSAPQAEESICEYPADDSYAAADEVYETDVSSAAEAYYAPPESDGAYPPWPDRGQPVPPARARMLRARRRLLVMLLLLTAVAGGCTAAKITSWWAIVPPAVLLGIYVLLLREAALADAEQARQRADLELRAEAARQRAQEEWLAEEEEEEPSAEIIDISARVGDQLYDQYADATERAVGD